MIHCSGKCTTGSCRLLLHPNRPLNWRGTQGVWLLISIPSLSFAAGLAALGFWPILPFAGMELALLYVAFYLSSLRQYRQEQVHITEHEIIITRTTKREQERIVLPRAWTRLQVRRDSRSWYPDRIQLLYCGRVTEIGTELTDAEKKQLGERLSAAGIALDTTVPLPPVVL